LAGKGVIVFWDDYAMPHVEPLEDLSLGSSIARIMARRQEMAAAWSTFSSTVRFSGLLSPELKEAVRAATAGVVGCEFCDSIGGEPPADADRRTSLACAVARSIVEDPGAVDQRTFALLREEFDDDEIVELLLMVCIVCLGGQTFGQVVGAEPADAAEAEAYRRRKAERIAKVGG
jgi:alkylhydroperoxidase family enzyme